MKGKAVRGNLLLILTALIWGIAFVAQRMGLDHLGSFSFNGMRTLLGAFAVMPVALWSGKRENASKSDKRTLVIGGIACGAVLCMASNLQQAGLLYTSVGKAGFITALYILIVPLIGLLMGKRVTKLFWIAVTVAVMGMFLLTMRGAEPVSLGDLLVLASACLFAVHIMVIDHYSPKVDATMLSMIQFFVSGVLSIAVALMTGEVFNWTAVKGAMVPMLYSGILSCGVGYTLQIIAQKDVNPVVASLLMSLESVFAALAGWAILGQAMTGRELFGCGLVFAAIMLAQWRGSAEAETAL